MAKVVTYQSYVNSFSRISVTPEQEDLLVEHGAWPYGYSQVYYGLHEGESTWTDKEVRQMCGTLTESEKIVDRANEAIKRILDQATWRQNSPWYFTSGEDGELLFWQGYRDEVYYREYDPECIPKLEAFANEPVPTGEQGNEWHLMYEVTQRMSPFAVQGA